MALYRHDAPLAASPALTTTAGDAVLATLLRGRQFASVACKPLGRALARPEPRGIAGTTSSLSLNPGTAGGPRRVHWAGSYIR